MRAISTAKYIYSNYILGNWGNNCRVGPESRTHWMRQTRTPLITCLLLSPTLTGGPDCVSGHA